MMTTIEYIPQKRTTTSISVYHCGHETCAANHSFGPARRAHHLFHFILKGKGRFYQDNQCYHLGAGQGFLISPNHTTYYIADADDPWEYVWVGFDGYDAESLLQDCGLSERAPIYHDQNTDLGQCLLDLIPLCQTPDQPYQVLSQFYNIIGCMARHHVSPRQEADYFDQAIHFIFHNYSYDIKIADLAQHIGIDRTYLYKIFMAKTGVSPQQYLIRFRLHTACRLLEESTLNITEVAYSSGFKDTPSFCKQFKTHYGRTPTAYRKDPAVT